MISDEAGRAMSVISGIDACKQVEPGFWLSCVNRIVLDLDEAGHQDRVREIRAMLFEVWKTLPDKPQVVMCDRCEVAPGTAPVRSICGDCDDVRLCQSCFELHAREVFDEGRRSDAVLTGAALKRFRAAAEILIRATERDMMRKTAPSLADFGDGVDLAGPADSCSRGAGVPRLYGEPARDEPRSRVARPGSGDPPPAAGAGAGGAEEAP